MSIPSAADLTVRIPASQVNRPNRTPPAPPRQAKQDKQSGSARGRIGLFRPIGIGQVALWELAIVAVVATVHPWRTVSVVVVAVAFGITVPTSLRWSGLCAYQWVGVFLRFRRRQEIIRNVDPLGDRACRASASAGRSTAPATARGWPRSATRWPPWCG